MLEGNARTVYNVTTPPHPRLAVVDILGPGRMFGLIPAMDEGPYIAQLESMNPVRVVFAPRDSLIKEMKQHPEVAEDLIKQIAAFARKVEEWLISTL